MGGRVQNSLAGFSGYTGRHNFKECASGHQPTMNSPGSCSKVGISLLTPDTLKLRGNGRFISSRAPVNLTSEEILLHIITVCPDILIGGCEKL